MPKQIFCAHCGKELLFIKKGVPQLCRVVTVVAPHKCEELHDLPDNEESTPFTPKPLKTRPPNLNELFSGYEFFNNIKKEEPLPPPVDPGDKRPKSQVKTTVPLGVKNFLLSKPHIEGGD